MAGCKLPGHRSRIWELGYRVDRLEYVDSRGSARATLSLAKFSQIARGEFVSVLRPDLELAIREAVPRRVDLRYGRTVVAVGQSRSSVTATLDDGPCWRRTCSSARTASTQ